MYVSCCTMITIVVLTVVHLNVVIHWVWLWIECMSSMFDTGIWYMIRWSNKTCAVVNTCSSCIIPLLLTWWERIDLLDECCILSWIVYMFMIWYEFCCYMYFFQYFYHIHPSLLLTQQTNKQTNKQAGVYYGKRCCYVIRVCDWLLYVLVHTYIYIHKDKQTETFLCVDSSNIHSFCPVPSHTQEGWVGCLAIEDYCIGSNWRTAVCVCVYVCEFC